MNLHLQLIAETPDSTLSVLSMEGEFVCFVLEDGYRETKEPGRTRIPPGRYKIAYRKHGWFFEKHRQRWGHLFVPELLDVPGFSDILIHTGNEVQDTRGCLLVGTAASHNYAAQPPVFNIYPGSSTQAYLQLYDLLSGAYFRNEEVFIRVSRQFVMTGA